ncbi:MAG: ZIP family metal transporter [Candidatus Micrarchaeia archaeon]
MVFWETIAAVLLVSFASFAGVFSLALSKKRLDSMLFYFVSFASGSLIGAAFLDLLPEAVESGGAGVLAWAILGIAAFLVMEKFLHWYHCHKHGCREHAFTYLSLFGDGLHNFIDGMIIAAGFASGNPAGISVTIAILAHEIPQELGDFGLLLYGGFSKAKALAYNFLSALAAVAGALFVLLGFGGHLETVTPMLLAFGAGGFIYIACTDLFPEMHKHDDPVKSLKQLAAFALGVLVIIAASALFGAA